MKEYSIFCLLGALALSTVACSVDPRNGAVLDHKWSTVVFDGLTDVKSAPYKYYQKNNTTGAYDFLLDVQAQSTPWTTDVSGLAWYGWQSAPTQLKQDAKYWANGTDHKIQTLIKGTDPVGSAHDALLTFDVDANDCIVQHANDAPHGPMTACISKVNGSPRLEVVVYAKCGTTNEACCLSPQTACDSGNTCKSGTCVAQQPAGGSCSVTSDCLSGNTCVGGVCTIVCPTGSCTVSGQVGECAKNGVWQCTTTTKTCAQTVFPTTEVCDGKDNDCDNSTDEGIAETSCNYSPSNCGGKSFPGHNKCVSGHMSCTATRQVDYCDAAQDATVCGAPVSTSNACTSDHDCAPNSVCDTTPGSFSYHECRTTNTSTGQSLCPTSPVCWTISQRGGSCIQ